MASYSGKQGTLKKGDPAVEVTDVRNWVFRERDLTLRWASNMSGAWRRALPGVREFSGSFQAHAQDGLNSAPAYAGERVTLQLHVDGTGDNFINAPVLITEAQIRIDLDDGQVVLWEFAFTGSGEPTKNGSLLIP